MLSHTTNEEKATTGQLVWETIVGLTNEERSITRQVLREATGLSYEVIDDHIKRLETAGKIFKVGKGLIEIVPKYPPERVQSLTPLPNGKVKWEMGDIYAEFTPPEARRHAMMFTGFARQFEDIESSNKALIRTAELADRIRELERTVAALKKPKNDAQLDLLAD
ncbi:hypothetical protein LJR074_002172 [Acidovorax sp. LjRoot74]|uniref:hypothetical protein n=1 Tax=Acidovorax sp. LjRoot74 TaxID=3342337 RepID=UPI003ECC471C